ncbi:hypothetical protein GLOIN_2v716768 [Rhizophagus irregularis DAOM 181602=DAOM 197198]|uniref:Uncharacterized protein n=1 Tax=Rhizophagus irregularis (strain DAOM 181602 / DAOM 197198 / MUCL 43194) TaxID=747089 RepID=A0A2P4QKA8_RHIID|nr:hypothetical protein GLOIN_2v716768 [Rhizophagus irregularis DAOM 181602=DAOM 197198]POG78087.1 hypothetical protein GLOIN_2v716768 [Rhizophagus irregularis DAOM 181602=DAOM 197198]GET60770.1 hypothetical protein GLOIN_2v716768 [Rhizophagus irregularis DAOM 181602=DAOM 197198]|eukprot:XP_025184953.1 hypothetical protein GLOIN_2v716768 [Rhizophagus irregularis DAOM 181602=DAOM 197198]
MANFKFSACIAFFIFLGNIKTIFIYVVYHELTITSFLLSLSHVNSKYIIKNAFFNLTSDFIIYFICEINMNLIL